MYNDQRACKDTVPTTLGYRPSLTERLKGERTDLATRLAELDAAIGALEANPQVQAIFDLVQKVSRY